MLARDYTYEQSLLIIKEMVDELCLSMSEKGLTTNSLSLMVGYSGYTEHKPATGTVALPTFSNSYRQIIPHVLKRYEQITDKDLSIRRLGISCNRVAAENYEQYDLFTDYAAVEREYERIVRSFISKGVSILNFETFPDMEHILPVIHKIRQEYDIFVMISFSVNQYGYSASGLSARRLLSEAAKSEDIDAVGLNCGVSAGHMCQLFDRMELPSGKYLMALPNAGYPVISRSQLQFGRRSGRKLSAHRPCEVREP